MEDQVTKRQFTKTVFLRRGGKNTSVMVSVIRRKNYGRRFDVVQLYIQSLSQKEPIFMEMTPGEAIEISAALAWGAREFIETFKPYLKWEKSLDKK